MVKGQRIYIDFDVYKALTVRRASPNESYNDVLRKLLLLRQRKGWGDGDGGA